MSTTPAPSTILTNDDAIRYLVAHGDDEEFSTSEYWREHKQWFKIDASGKVEGNSVLGNVSPRRSFIYAVLHRIFQFPLKRLGRQYRDLGACEKIGRAVARRRQQQFTYDTLRHVFSLALIRQHCKDVTQNSTSLVIGDGFGIMASLLLACHPSNRVLVVNLTKSLALDLVYLQRAFPDAETALVLDRESMRAALENTDVRVIAVQADNADLLAQASFQLVVNIVSMQEMDLPVISRYFDVIRNNPSPSTYFYCCNRRFKTSNFEEYPWRDGDNILEEGICEWSQRYYSNRPPFMHKRDYGKKVVLHRLVKMEKNHE
ncbi:MAG: putative sugar O-methyltransferase [Rhodospirillales bacterium]